MENDRHVNSSYGIKELLLLATIARCWAELRQTIDRGIPNCSVAQGNNFKPGLYLFVHPTVQICHRVIINCSGRTKYNMTKKIFIFHLDICLNSTNKIIFILLHLYCHKQQY